MPKSKRKEVNIVKTLIYIDREVHNPLHNIVEIFCCSEREGKIILICLISLIESDSFAVDVEKNVVAFCPISD